MSLIGRLSRKLGFYEWIRYSLIYDIIGRFRNPGYLRSLNEDWKFYRKILGEQPVDLIFDVGANQGDKAIVFSRLARRVVCFEPDPRLATHLRKRFRNVPQIVVEECGLSDREGIAELHAYGQGSAYNTFDHRQHQRVGSSQASHQLLTVPVTTLDAMIAKHGRPQFLKVDVEGHERQVFSGLSTPIGFISYEANLPEFAEETVAIARQLESMASRTAFAVGGSGREMTGDFPLSAAELGLLVQGPEAPRFFEVFVQMTGVSSA